MVTVYADVLFCINFFVDFALLSVCSLIMKKRIKKLRLTLCAALGAAYSVAVFLPKLSFLTSLGIKLLFSGVITLAAFGFRNIFAYLKALSVFYAVSLGFGGAVFGAYTLLEPSGMLIRNSVIYINVEPFYLFLIIGIAYCGVWIFCRILPKRSERHCSVTLELNGKSVRITALHDSGNMLTDILSGAPVMLAELSAVEHLLPKSVRRAFRSPSLPCAEAAEWGHGFRLIPAQGAFGKEALLPAFRPDRVKVTDGKEVFITDGAFLAVTDRMLCADGRYNALIGDAFLITKEVAA